MNIYSAFKAAAERYGDQIVLYQPQGSSYFTRTYGDALTDIETVAAHLATLPLGKGDKVAILAENRYEWWVAYLATVSLGLVAVPLDTQLGLHDWQHFLQHAEVKLLFLSDRLANHTEALTAGVPLLKQVIHFGEELATTPLSRSYQEIVGRAGEQSVPLEQAQVNETDIASIIYTAGTGGIPRGVMLTHGNLLSNALVAGQGWAGRGLIAVSILPAHHVYGLTTALSGVLQGTSGIIYPIFNQETLLNSLRDLSPHIILGVPAFYQRIANAIETRLFSKSPRWLQRLLEQQLYGWMGAKSSRLHIVKRILFWQVHQRLGGRIKYMVSGGAPLDPRLIRFFNLLGIMLYEGYGLTETSPLVAANDAHNYRIGSVGKPVPGVKVKIDRPNATGMGEIWVKGPGVMKGYYKDPEATRAVIDSTGWFHTGDVGYLDRDGFLFIAGRKREVIVTPEGKNVYPDEVEQYFGHIPLIKEVCIFGVSKHHRGREELVHMQVVPDREEAKRQGITDVESAIKQETARRPDQLSTYLPDYKRPKSIGFSDDPFPSTTTLKIKKFAVKAAYLADLKQKRAQEVSRAETEPLLHSPVGSLVIKILKNLLPADAVITANSFLSVDLGLDSLATIEFWTNLEQSFGVPIPEQERFALNQVGQIINYLEKKQVEPQKVPKRPLPVEGSTEPHWPDIIDEKSEEIRGIVQGVTASPSWIRMISLRVFRLIFKYICRLRVEGLENLPKQGPYILASNHVTIFDYLFVASLLPRPVQKNLVVMAREDFFRGKSLRRWLVTKFGQAPMVDIFKASLVLLRMSAEVLRQGKVLLVFPETIRTFDGDLLSFKNGVGLLANRLQCPIIPAYIRGGYEFFPRGSMLPKHRGNITVILGKPLEPIPALKPTDQSKVVEKAQKLTEQLRQAMIRMRKLE